jgi:hypothetical protein
MRPATLLAAVLLSLLLAPFALAQGEVRFYADHPDISPGVGAYVVLLNDGHPELRDVAVEIRLSSGLAFFNEPSPDGWTCTRENSLTITCRISSFATDRLELFPFTLQSTDPSGGVRTVRATLTARDLQPKVVEFRVVTNVALRVTTAADFGPGSLRAALEEVEDNPLCGTHVPCIISFNPLLTIAPLSPLPPIRKCNVGLYGPLELGPKSVIITGERASYGNGLEVRASCPPNVAGVSIQSLSIHSWPWNGIYFEAPAAHAGFGSHQVHNCHIGTDPTGSFARPNGSRGIVTDSPYEVLNISSSVISGNGRSGIALFRGKAVNISSCKIGTDLRLGPLPNGASGVFSAGVPVRLDGNVIAYNAHAGLAFTSGTRAFTLGPNFSNGGLPVDANIDGRTPDDDEHDGVLNAPRITEAFYSEATGLTTIRGVIRLRAGTFGTYYGIIPYLAFDDRGDPAEVLNTSPVDLAAPEDGSAGDVVFEMQVARDLRGNFVSLQAFAGETVFGSRVVSEVSEGVVVR